MDFFFNVNASAGHVIQFEVAMKIAHEIYLGNLLGSLKIIFVCFQIRATVLQSHLGFPSGPGKDKGERQQLIVATLRRKFILLLRQPIVLITLNFLPQKQANTE